jgi:threonine/homoserine/homoserine lactone efflux protein
MLLLIAGFVLSLFGSLPPGLISLSVAQTSILRGKYAAMAVALGAAFAEFFQAWAAVVLTDWFLSHPAAERWFHWAALPVFLGIGIHLVFFAKPPKPPEQLSAGSFRRQFLKGLILSAFNLLAIPYWFVYCGWLRVEGWWQDGFLSTQIFSLGVSLGTVFALGLYIWLGQMLLNSSKDVARYANRVIGLIFLGLGLKIILELIG